MAPTVWLLLLFTALAAQAYRTTLRDRNNNEIVADLGIRYAKAATFERPSQPLAADNDGNYEQQCPQNSVNFQAYNENCLLLNIYRRKDPSNGITKKPVVVYLHPGMFHQGSKDMVGPKHLLTTSDIVLVTVNYRLGALGFLSTNDSDAPGNMGLWDQKAALLWVKQNIETYGGRSDSITLMGHGAGAACVGFHLLHSGMNPQNFHRAVMISGGPLDPWAIQHRPREEAEILAERLSCPKSRYNMVRCIASRGAERIVKATEQDSKLWFGPVIDNATRDSFFDGDPRWLLNQAGRFLPDIPILIGHTAREGSFYFYEKNKDLQQGKSNLYLFLGQLLRPLLNDTRNLDSIVAAVKYHYHIRGKENASSVEAASAHIIQALTDFMYASGADQLYRLSAMNSGGSTYRYIFNHTSTSMPSLLDDMQGYVNRDKAGSTHLSDLFYYFDTTLGRGSGTLAAQDTSIVDNMVRILDNFVKGQAPPGIQSAQTYRQNRAQEIIYVIENGNYPKPNALEWQERMDLWNVLVPELESVDVTPDPDPELEHFRSATWGLTAFLVILIVVATLAGSVVLYRRKQRRPTPRDTNLQGKELAKL